MDNAVKQIIDALQPLATKLGEAGEAIYRSYYKQTVITGVEMIIGAVFGIIIVIFLRRAIIKAPWKRDDKVIAYWLATLASIVICTILVFGLMLQGINQVANPTYYTIQLIKSSVTGK